MRVLVQRVKEAQVSVSGEAIASIGPGFLLLVGFGNGDGSEELTWMARKISGLRVFSDEDGQMNRSIQHTNGEILAVSQFTLYGDCRKGRRPSFVDALDPIEANQLFEEFLQQLSEQGVDRVEKGKFGADMDVQLVNDGPVTLWLAREPGD
mgnify:CR=1 FL=1